MTLIGLMTLDKKFCFVNILFIKLLRAYVFTKTQKNTKKGTVIANLLAYPEPKANEKVILYFNILVHFSIDDRSACAAG